MIDLCKRRIHHRDTEDTEQTKSERRETEGRVQFILFLSALVSLSVVSVSLW